LKLENLKKNWGEDIKQYYFVVQELVSREIKRKYARSFLGIVWSVLNPLMSMAVMSMIFSTIFKRSIENFPIYYLTGTIFWGLFSGATSSAMTALVDNKNLLLKAKLPKQIFVLSRVYTSLTNFGYTCVAYVVMLLFFKIELSVTMLLFPIPVFFALLFSLGLGYLLSIVYVFFADIKYLYSILLTLWMYMSAIFYPYESTAFIAQKIIMSNPVFIFIHFARQVVMYQTIPEPIIWKKMIFWGVGMFVVGYYVFKQKENLVMQRV